jgi:hypothetical protein
MVASSCFSDVAEQLAKNKIWYLATEKTIKVDEAVMVVIYGVLCRKR